MQKTILSSIGAALLIAACAIIATCQPAPAPPAETTASSTGAGGSGPGDAAATADSATPDAGAPDAASVTSTGALPAGCVGPTPKHTACDNTSDCYDGTACTTDACDLATPPNPPDPFGRRGTCRWTALPDGEPCDVSDGADSCRSGACCPPGALPPATEPPAPAATAIQPPEAR